MPWDNSTNPARGRDFEAVAQAALAKHFGVTFISNEAIPIGDPAKLHRFDLVSEDIGSVQYVGECKCYGWTETGNVPSAKMAFINEAILYLGLIPAGACRFIVMPRSVHPRRAESLAEYYYRTYRHLLRGISVIELDVVTGEIRVFAQPLNGE
jgi:hypothetical protein